MIRTEHAIKFDTRPFERLPIPPGCFTDTVSVPRVSINRAFYRTGTPRKRREHPYYLQFYLSVALLPLLVWYRLYAGFKRIRGVKTTFREEG